MEFKPKNREWVKSAAIVFLAVLLVLTFFSKTISNRLLTEVATASVQSGAITAKVRGSGTVSANGSHEVKATQTREVGSVLIKVGQEVNTGDMLFTLGSGDSEELEAAYEVLRELQQSYRSSASNMPQFNYEREQYSYAKAEEAYDTASDELRAAQNDYDNAVHSAEAKAAMARIEASEGKVAEETEILNSIVVYLASQQDLEDINDQLSQHGLDPEAKAYLEARKQETESILLEEKTFLAGKGIIDPMSAKSDVESALEREQNNLEIYRQEYYRLLGQYEDALAIARQGFDDAENKFNTANYELESSISAGQQQINSVSVQLQGISDQIAAQQEKIKKLTGEDGDGIVSNVSGIVQSISVTSGDKVMRGDVMCVIEVPDMGHTVSFSVTNEQAKRLRIGDSAKVSNFYWGNEIIATLTTMVNDPKSPQTNKLLTFELEGDVTSGEQITVSVGSKSAGYDTVIPNSAIRTDTNGSFVLAIEAKNSPIGNRYIAKRVNVEVVASDDENSAVTGALSNGDFVITTTSAPVKSGDQVRLADSNE